MLVLNHVHHGGAAGGQCPVEGGHQLVGVGDTFAVCAVEAGELSEIRIVMETPK